MVTATILDRNVYQQVAPSGRENTGNAEVYFERRDLITLPVN